MKVAIIGTGVSGLVAARLLAEIHDVTVFEADERPGGHAHTVEVDTASGPLAIDTGFIVFNDRNYPLFRRLLAELKVTTQPTSMSFSVSDDDGSFEFSSGSVSGAFAKRSHIIDPRFHRLCLEVLRCQRSASELAQQPEANLSLGHWLEREGFSADFIAKVVVPMAASVWSADPAQMWEFPASFMAEFFENHGMLRVRHRPKWHTVAGGSRTYVDQIVDDLGGRLRLSSPVERITRQEDAVSVTVRGEDPQRFDQVVLATHSDQVLRMLGDPTAEELELLHRIPYLESEVVLHTDERLLPRRRRAWASWNYHLLEKPPEQVVMTYDMTRLQRLPTPTRYCLTLNRADHIDPARIIRRFRYAHPVFGADALDVQQRLRAVSGRNRTHFCGAYLGWGFHEDGVRTGARVAQALGGRSL